MEFMVNNHDLLSTDDGSGVSLYPAVFAVPTASESTVNVWDVNVDRSVPPECGFVYGHVFSFSPEPDASLPVSKRQQFEGLAEDAFLAREAAIIMYNVALVKQLKAMSRTEAKDKASDLAKSAYLYQLVYYTIVTLQSSDDILSDPYFRLLLMATCNNMANVLFHIGNYTEADACVEQLGYLLVYSSSFIEIFARWMKPEDFEGFLSTLMFLRPPTNAAAA